MGGKGGSCAGTSYEQGSDSPEERGADCTGIYCTPVNNVGKNLLGGREVAKARRPAVDFHCNPKRRALDLSCSKQRFGIPSGLLS